MCGSGSDAVEAALKTALIATGKPGVIAFEGAYHGLSLGALDVTHREEFRAPFAGRLPRRSVFLPYGDAAAVRGVLRSGTIGAVLVEPVQGRGGTDLRPVFAPELRRAHRAEGIVAFTDGQGPVPASPPDVPVLFVLTKPDDFACPWGTRALFSRPRGRARRDASPR